MFRCLVGLRFRKGEGRITFNLHRLTGLGMLSYLMFHILESSTVFFMPWLYKRILSLYQSVPFFLGETLLLFCVAYHGVNGLRITIFDLVRPDLKGAASEKKAVRIALVAAFVLWLPAVVIIGRRFMMGFPEY
ncbi:MAG: hypothetical protein AB1345_12145 [Chloroflexota bacterium]